MPKGESKSDRRASSGPKSQNPRRASPKGRDASDADQSQAGKSANSAAAARPPNQGSSNPDQVRSGDSGRSAGAFESPRIEDRRSEVDAEAADASTNPDPLATPERSQAQKDLDPTGKSTAMGSCNCPPGQDLRP